MARLCLLRAAILAICLAVSLQNSDGLSNSSLPVYNGGNGNNTNIDTFSREQLKPVSGLTRYDASQNVDKLDGKNITDDRMDHHGVGTEAVENSEDVDVDDMLTVETDSTSSSDHETTVHFHEPFGRSPYHICAFHVLFLHRVSHGGRKGTFEVARDLNPFGDLYVNSVDLEPIMNGTGELADEIILFSRRNITEEVPKLYLKEIWLMKYAQNYTDDLLAWLETCPNRSPEDRDSGQSYRIVSTHGGTTSNGGHIRFRMPGPSQTYQVIQTRPGYPVSALKSQVVCHVAPTTVTYSTTPTATPYAPPANYNHGFPAAPAPAPMPAYFTGYTYGSQQPPPGRPTSFSSYTSSGQMTSPGGYQPQQQSHRSPTGDATLGQAYGGSSFMSSGTSAGYGHGVAQGSYNQAATQNSHSNAAPHATFTSYGPYGSPPIQGPSYSSSASQSLYSSSANQGSSHDGAETQGTHGESTPQELYGASSPHESYSNAVSQKPHSAPSSQTSYPSSAAQTGSYNALHVEAPYSPSPDQGSYGAPSSQISYSNPAPQESHYAAPTRTQEAYAGPDKQRSYAGSTAQVSYAVPSAQSSYDIPPPQTPYSSPATQHGPQGPYGAFPPPSSYPRLAAQESHGAPAPPGSSASSAPQVSYGGSTPQGPYAGPASQGSHGASAPQVSYSSPAAQGWYGGPVQPGTTYEIGGQTGGQDSYTNQIPGVHSESNYGAAVSSQYVSAPSGTTQTQHGIAQGQSAYVPAQIAPRSSPAPGSYAPASNGNHASAGAFYTAYPGTPAYRVSAGISGGLYTPSQGPSTGYAMHSGGSSGHGNYGHQNGQQASGYSYGLKMPVATQGHYGNRPSSGYPTKSPGYGYPQAPQQHGPAHQGQSGSYPGYKASSPPGYKATYGYALPPAQGHSAPHGNQPYQGYHQAPQGHPAPRGYQAPHQAPHGHAGYSGRWTQGYSNRPQTSPDLQGGQMYAPHGGGQNTRASPQASYGAQGTPAQTSYIHLPGPQQSHYGYKAGQQNGHAPQPGRPQNLYRPPLGPQQSNYSPQQYTYGTGHLNGPPAFPPPQPLFVLKTEDEEESDNENDHMKELVKLLAKLPPATLAELLPSLKAKLNAERDVGLSAKIARLITKVADIVTKGKAATNKNMAQLVAVTAEVNKLLNGKGDMNALNAKLIEFAETLKGFEPADDDLPCTGDSCPIFWKDKNTTDIITPLVEFMKGAYLSLIQSQDDAKATLTDLKQQLMSTKKPEEGNNHGGSSSVFPNEHDPSFAFVPKNPLDIQKLKAGEKVIHITESGRNAPDPDLIVGQTPPATGTQTFPATGGQPQPDIATQVQPVNVNPTQVAARAEILP
ncbi:hypothetical protein BIW11_07854 [Tropilaelaps mercedesae]|uniref:Uncharacterized protein n=1 Tax=Tropilaelaps mercedesae TaxID=418985 RepID=A0A1V9XS80_9ACAR|nr:hypothetical protein BIW11_07854 [Tropilaelaps mercedesae]